MQTQLNVQLLSHTNDAEKIVATAAKLCYSNANISDIKDGLSQEDTDRFLNMLVEMGHESPVEHVSFSFGVEGVSRSLTHQLVRHRIASYSQQSQRYVDANHFNYIVPSSIEEDEEAKSIFVEHMEYTQECYNKLVATLMVNKCASVIPYDVAKENGPDYIMEVNPKLYKAFLKQCYEDARYVMPNAAETRIVLTMNVRALYNFFKHRCCDRAQWEIRELAYQMLILCRKIAPTLFAKAGPSCVHGKCPEGPMSCGNQLDKKRLYA